MYRRAKKRRIADYFSNTNSIVDLKEWKPRGETSQEQNDHYYATTLPRTAEQQLSVMSGGQLATPYQDSS